MILKNIVNFRYILCPFTTVNVWTTGPASCWKTTYFFGIRLWQSNVTHEQLLLVRETKRQLELARMAAQNPKTARIELKPARSEESE